MNTREPITHDEAVDRVLLAMLTSAANINRAAVLRAIAAVVAYLRAVNELSQDLDMESFSDTTPERVDAANAAALRVLCDTANGAERADPNTLRRPTAPLDGDELARAVVTLLLGVGPECAVTIAEMYEPGDLALAAAAERVDALRAMFTTAGGVA